MKVKPNYLHEATEADKQTDARRASSLRRNYNDQTDALNKPRQTISPVKDDLKFSSLLENSAKLEKPNQQRDDADQERRDDRKKEKKQHAQEKDSAETTAGENKSEKYESSNGGGQFGGQNGFGGGSVGQLNLNDSFAARSILHVADLERLVSTIRSQISLGGKREIILQLRRSVLEGLRVKIMTDPNAKVRIEFLAASDKVRAQIEKHVGELAEILRGRGVNLHSLTTALNSESDSRNSSNESDKIAELETSTGAAAEELPDDNTFGDLPANNGTIYQA